MVWGIKIDFFVFLVLLTCAAVVIATIITVMLVQSWREYRRKTGRSRTCGECKYFDEFDGAVDVRLLSGRGYCRKNTPVGFIDLDNVHQGIFPTVFFSDSCGQFDFGAKKK